MDILKCTELILYFAMNKTLYYYILLYILLLLIISCSTYDDFSFVCSNRSSREIRIDKLDLEKITVPAFETSMIGLTEIGNGRIYYADQKLRTIHEISPLGDSCRRVLRAGRSNREYAGSYDAFYSCGGNTFGIVSDCWVTKYEVDTIGMIQKSTILCARKNNNEKGLAENPNTYTLMYDQLRIKEYNDTLYFSIAGNHPIFNMYAPAYFNSARIVKGVPIQKDKASFVMGRLSPKIRGEKGRYQFFMFDFDMDEAGNFYVGYELDSLIYKFDHRFNIVETWGNSGRDMDFREHKTLTIADYRKNYQQERKKSHYRKICRIGRMTFRTYVKNSAAETDGLQIYDDNTLIADVDIPKGIDVIGKIGDYYYTNLLGDEILDNNILWFYRFKI